MCLICVELANNKLTSIEARRNLKEVAETLERSHIEDVLQSIWSKEDEEYQSMWPDETD
jgi:antitoxin component of MazEF toxin-antitoxin module